MLLLPQYVSESFSSLIYLSLCFFSSLHCSSKSLLIPQRSRQNSSTLLILMISYFLFLACLYLREYSRYILHFALVVLWLVLHHTPVRLDIQILQVKLLVQIVRVFHFQFELIRVVRVQWLLVDFKLFFQIARTL